MLFFEYITIQCVCVTACTFCVTISCNPCARPVLEVTVIFPMESAAEMERTESP